MTHEELSELYELFAWGVLEPEERDEVDQHLARNCPECREGVRHAMALGPLFAGGLPEQAEPSKRLRNRVLAAVGVEPKTNRWWLAGLSFVTGCLLAAVGWMSMQNARRGTELATVQTELRRSGSDLARVQSALEFLNEPATRQVVFGTGPAQPPRGRVFVNATKGVLLIASNLPAPPSGKIYEMWLVPKNGAPPVPAGLFQSDAQGNALYLRREAFDVAGTKAVAVTLEPEAGSATPTSALVIVAGLSE